MARLRLIPRPGKVKRPTAGTYLFVDYGVAAEPWHERYVLKVIHGYEAIALTPDGEVIREKFDVPPIRQVVFWSEVHVPPPPFGKPRGHPVYRFERAVSASKVKGLSAEIDEMAGQQKEKPPDEVDSFTPKTGSHSTPKQRVSGKSAPAVVLGKAKPPADPAGERLADCRWQERGR